MPDSVNDKRRYHRHELSGEIRLLDASGQQSAAGVMLNVSDGGALVDVPVEQAPGLGSTVTLEFSVPSATGQGRNFSAAAKVLRRQASGWQGRTSLGLQFLDVISLGL